MYVVLGEEKGKIRLVSTSKAEKGRRPGILPKGSFLTVETENNKHILRVDDSQQNEPYSPAPMLADMDLAPLRQDQKCQNIVYAYRIGEVNERTDGKVDYIPPQSLARRSTQEEIDKVLSLTSKGPKVFLATIYAGKNQLLQDDEAHAITVSLPDEMFYYQTLVCGKTGSGKTVAMKYLAQYFVEDLSGFGAVLAVNVKDIDLLRMDKPSVTSKLKLLKEWKELGQKPHGIENFIVYYPANSSIDSGRGVNMKICKRITIDVRQLDPDALAGLMVGISDIGAQHLPNIFRFWQEDQRRRERDFSFRGFVEYFERGKKDNYNYETRNARGDPLPVTLPWGTYENIMRSLISAMEFFDNENAETIDARDILVRGKMSVINVVGEKGFQFGAVMLRHLLKRIVAEKQSGNSDVPILIVIDEVHQFYDTGSSREALGVLDTICRTGRDKKIAVIFSSQTPSDMPRGLFGVANTKVFFKSDRGLARDVGIQVTSEEVQSLGKGYAIADVQGVPQVRVMKFPLALAGVFDDEK
jgi:Cdc6-like AAA superfamily ATPase